MTSTNRMAKRRKRNPQIRRAIEVTGSLTSLAKASGLSVPHISRLLWRERNVTAPVAIAIEKGTRGKITRQALLPDIFGRP